MRVDHDGRRYELGRHQVLALHALSVGYERIDRIDGLMLTMLGLAYKSAYGFKITQEGRDALLTEGKKNDEVSGESMERKA